MKIILLTLTLLVAITVIDAHYYRHGHGRYHYRPHPRPPPVVVPTQRPAVGCPGTVGGKMLFCSNNCPLPQFVPVSGVPGCATGLTCCTQK